tara:strand:- start:5810 stop:7219 length:1410 start_codon:yes stop_codon:yes gene_type:complete
MTIFVLGAGPSGLAIVDGIIDDKVDDFIVLEKSKSIGGLAQTVHWDKIGYHDLGPHKIFSQDKKLTKRVEDLLPSQKWLTREKISSVFMNKYFLPYPPSPFSLGKVFGIKIFINMCIGYGIAMLKNLLSKAKPDTFEEDLIRRLGSPLYNVLFKPIAVKLWGDPKTLDVKLSQGRVQTPSLIEVFSKSLGFNKNSEFEALTFRYPINGLSEIWKSIEIKSKNHGKFLLEHNISGFKVANNRIIEIKSTYDGNEVTHKVNENDFVVTSLPLGITIPLLLDNLESNTQNLLDEVVHLNDLLLIFLHIDKPKFLDESWVFVPDPSIVFHRISEQESFDPNMINNGSVVCCEIMSSKDRKMIDKSDEELFKLTEEGLKNMGYSDFNIKSQRIIKLPKSYPVFKKGYEPGLKEILKRLDKFQNFKTIGRQGAFNYIGTLDAMDIGYGFINWYKQRKLLPWQDERNRTSLYPVLD